MKRTAALLLLALVAIGCNEDKSTKVAQTTSTATATGTTSGTVDPKEAEEIKENLAKLSPEDRALAEKQKYCAIQTKSRLGSMDVPVKIMVKGEPVFICCEGCEKAALKDPDKTLQTVKELKEKAAKEAK
jgi:hypothetical protein